MNKKLISIGIVLIFLSTGILTVSGHKQCTNDGEYKLKILTPRKTAFNPLKILVKTSGNIDFIQIGIQYDQNKDGTAEWIWVTDWDDPTFYNLLNIWKFTYKGDFKTKETVNIIVSGYHHFDDNGDGINDISRKVVGEEISVNVINLFS